MSTASDPEHAGENKLYVGRTLVACLIAGFVAPLLTILLWPLLMIGISGGFSGDWETVLYGLIGAGFFALLIGLGLSLVAGFPLLMFAQRLGINRVPVMAAVGAVISLALGLSAGWPVEAWLLYAGFGAVGAGCGGVASLASRGFYRAKS